MSRQRKGKAKGMALNPQFTEGVYDAAFMQVGTIIQVHDTESHRRNTYKIVSRVRIVRDPETKASSRQITGEELKRTIFGWRETGERRPLDLCDDLGITPYVDHNGVKWWSTRIYTAVLRGPRA